MQLRESTVILADAASVWPFLADPVLQADWNPKLVSIERERSGPVRFGERFEVIYRMSGRENHSRVEVTVARPLERAAKRLHAVTTDKALATRTSINEFVHLRRRAPAGAATPRYCRRRGSRSS